MVNKGWSSNSTPSCLSSELSSFFATLLHLSAPNGVVEGEMRISKNKNKKIPQLILQKFTSFSPSER
jgi:hypothetical protein